MIGEGVPNCEPNSQHRRALIVAINAFSDEMLLETFYHCRPVLLDEHEADDNLNIEGTKWENERWWYKLIHVCRKWRCLVLASVSHLGVYLLCTYSTPLVDMPTYLPTLPLMIDYGDEDREVTEQDKEGILLALRCRCRVRRIRLCMPAPTLRRLLATMDGDFPALEHLYIKLFTNDAHDLSLPDTFNAPLLRHFALRNVTYPPDMFHPPPPIRHLPSTEKNSQFVLYHSPQSRRFLKLSVHTLDDDSLLNIFQFCRPVMVDENETSSDRILQGGEWDRERWWYKLVHVCRRWRCLILTSPSHLNLSLVCTRGTPVADMLSSSPPLPLILDHIHGNGGITAEDEEGIIFALQHRDRVCRIRLEMPDLDLRKLILAMDEEFPILQYLYIAPTTTIRSSWLILPNTFRAPRLRHFVMRSFIIPTRSPLIMTNTGLVTLTIRSIPQLAYSHPNDLLEQISLMTQLETLKITFHSPFPYRELEKRLVQRPVMTRVTLPNLRWLGLRASSTYMEALLPQISAPLLEKLEARHFPQLNFSMPHLLEFMIAAENLKFGSATLWFADKKVLLHVFSHEGAPMYSFATDINYRHMGWQVSFIEQNFRTLRTVFSAVEHLTLKFRRNDRSGANSANLTKWRDLLRSFSNVKILRVNRDFRGQISRSLQVDDEQSPLELLPELKELHYPRTRGDSNTFKAFIDARRNAGHPVTLVRY